MSEQASKASDSASGNNGQTSAEPNTQVRTEAQALAQAYTKTREITRFFFSKIPDERFAERPKAANGYRFNSAQWIMGHLIWSEDYLLLKCLDGPRPDLPWLKQFALGSDPQTVEVQLSRDALKEHAKAMHQMALEHVRSLSDADLDKESGIPMFPTWRETIMHAIRHEGNHGGHVGWLVKMLDGEKTI